MKFRFVSFFAAVIMIAASVQVLAQPDPPANLSASLTTFHNHQSVQLQWDPSPAAAVRYNIYKKNGAISDTGDFRKVFSFFRLTKFNDRNVLPGRTYSYYVTAVNITGESLPSAMVEIVVAAPPAPAYVYGKVTDETTGNSLPLALVKFIPQAFGPFNVNWTDSLGNYGKRILPGSYYVYTAKFGFVPEYFDNVSNIQAATLITINPGDSVEYNFSLSQYVPPVIQSLTGNVSDAGGNPQRATVFVYRMRQNSHFYFHRSVRTDSLGNYTVQAAEGDTVIVFVKPFDRNFLPEYYNNKRSFAEADRIHINGTVSNIDFILETKPVFANGISGIVKNSDNQPVQAHIVAFKKDRVPHQRFRYAVMSDTLGVYSFTNMNPGEYILIAHPLGNYIPTFFRYDGTQTLNWSEADSVVVDSSAIIDNINFTVLPRTNVESGVVMGKIVDNLGTPISGSIVYAENENGIVTGFALSDQDGKYSLNGLETGNYNITADKIYFNSGISAVVNIESAVTVANGVNFVLNQESVTDQNEEPVTVSNYSLLQNYPNPFNPVTNIQFSIPEKANVKITVYNILGKEIAVLVNRELGAGEHAVSFNAADLSSGVYFYRLEAGGFTSTRKMTLLK